MKISINELRQMIREEVIASTDDPTVVMYKVEPGDTETLIINKFEMTEEDYRRLNPEEFKGEGSTVKVKKLVDPCKKFPDITEKELRDVIGERLDLSNLRRGLDYKSIAGDHAIKVFKYGKLPSGKDALYSYRVGIVSSEKGKGVDLGDMLPDKLKNSLLKLGKQILVMKVFDQTGLESAKVFKETAPVIVAQNEDDTFSFVQWDDKKFVKGQATFKTPVIITKAIINEVDKMLQPYGGLEMIVRCRK
tara:strand:- start:1951 stop:2694 length:744 start_codon:yes stop_codon:yes gene_type:complete